MVPDQNPTGNTTRHIPWNKERLTSPKPPLKLREIWAIRTRLQMVNRSRDLAAT